MMMLFDIFLSITIVFSSMVLGIFFCKMFTSGGYFNSLKGYRLIRDEKTANLIGVGVVKWLVYKTFWRRANPALTIAGYPSIQKLSELKEEMTKAEVGHLIGFFVVATTAVVFLLLGM